MLLGYQPHPRLIAQPQGVGAPASAASAYVPGLSIVMQLPAWPPGFTANFTAEILTAAARGFLPWYHLNPLPPLYESGVVFALEPNHGAGWEDYSNPWMAYARGWVDCDDATIWRLVELMAAGEHAEARGHETPRTRADWVGPEIHVQVRRKNGELEDPVMNIPWYQPNQQPQLPLRAA